MFVVLALEGAALAQFLEVDAEEVADGVTGLSVIILLPRVDLAVEHMTVAELRLV